MDQVIFKSETEKREREEYIEKIVTAVLYCARQGIALRGHDEAEDSENRGNFLEFCQVFAKYFPDFNTHFQKYFNDTSPEVQNQIINLICESIVKQITDEIRKAGAFSIMADEARYSKKEQLSLCIRYTDPKLKPQERFLKFLDSSSCHNAKSLKDKIVSELKNLGIDDIPMVAQTYDGANKMSGKDGGVQKFMKEDFPFAEFYHCGGHKAALVIVGSCEDLPECRKFFNILQTLFIHYSNPGNHSTLLRIQKLLNVKPFEITSLSETRWACRYTNCIKVRDNFSVILEALNQEIEEVSSQVVEAKGLLHSLLMPSFVVYLYIFTDILAIIHLLSKSLQSENMTLGLAKNNIKSVLDTLQKKRDNGFSELWSKIELLSREYDISLTPDIVSGKKRKSIESHKLKDSHILSTIGAREYQNQEMPEITNEEYWKTHHFNRIVDTIKGHMEIRFSEESLKIASAVDKFFEFDFQGMEPFVNAYSQCAKLKLDTNLLKSEIEILKNLFFQLPEEKRNFENARKLILDNQTMVKNTMMLAKVAIAIPISSTTPERSFSSMRRLWNWLRRTTLQERFSNLSLIYIERIQINIKDIVAKYLTLPGRRYNLHKK